MKTLIAAILALSFMASTAISSPLCDEVTSDTLTRGYSGMTPAQIVADLNTVYRTRNRTSMTGQEVWEETNYLEFAAKTDAEKSQWLALTSNTSLDPFGNSVELAKSIFGQPSATITALANARIEAISRAEELGLGNVQPGHVEECLP